MTKFKPYVPGQPITQQPEVPAAEPAPADPAPLSPVEAGYPLTIRWPDGVEECYYTRAMLRYAIHTRSLLQSALALGGVVSNVSNLLT